MEPYESVDAYRRRLLASLHVQPCQDHEVEFDSLQVFVNHECVGTVACDESTQAMAAITQPRPIQTVEVRAATGLLIGSLCAQDLRMKMARIPMGHHVLEISIHNRVDGGSVQVAYQSAKPESIHARPLSTQGRAKVAQPSDIPLRRWLPRLISAQYSSRWSRGLCGRGSFSCCRPPDGSVGPVAACGCAPSPSCRVGWS